MLIFAMIILYATKYLDEAIVVILDHNLSKGCYPKHILFLCFHLMPGPHGLFQISRKFIDIEVTSKLVGSTTSNYDVVAPALVRCRALALSTQRTGRI